FCLVCSSYTLYFTSHSHSCLRLSTITLLVTYILLLLLFLYLSEPPVPPFRRHLPLNQPGRVPAARSRSPQHLQRDGGHCRWDWPGSPSRADSRGSRKLPRRRPSLPIAGQGCGDQRNR